MRRFAAALVPLLVAGCIADGPQPPERPTPRVIEQPPGLTVELISLSHEAIALDSDGNGFADRFTAFVYLFADTSQHQVPIHQPGVFRFRLDDPDGRTVAEWRFDEAQVAEARDRTAVGPCYIFPLSLNDVGTDRVAPMYARVDCMFEPEGSDPLRLKRATTIRIGALRPDALRSVTE